MTPTNPILLLLLFRDVETSLELGPPLWAALQEVEQFYQVLWPKREFRRVYLAGRVPDAIRAEIPLDWEATQAAFGDQGFWRLALKEAKGRYTRTCDQERLGELVREHLIHQGSLGQDGSAYVEWLRTGRVDAASPPGPGRDASGTEKVTTASEARKPWDLNRVQDLTMILVTDQQITPPPDWRYIIWDGIRAGSVISIAPTNPNYWHADDPDRVATIKHRVRTACLCSVGEFLGLKRCQNPTCLLYAEVDSVSCLDGMVLLGREHRKKKLTNHGFEPKPRQPNVVQPIIAIPDAGGGSVGHE